MHIQDQLEIRLLGSTLVRRRDGRVVTAREWRTAKSLELLHLLAVSQPTPVPVDLVLERLWPQAPAKNAQASLRTTLYHVRSAMGDDAIERTGDALTLNNAWTDVHAYAVLAGDIEHARRAGQHLRVASLARAAAALYVRDINASCSSEWAMQAQSRWRQLRQSVLLAAAEAAVAIGRLDEALDHAGEARAIDSSSERAVRALMRAHGGLGEIRKAIAAYETLRKELAESYGVDPAPQTRALHLQLLQNTAERPHGGALGAVEPVGHTLAIERLSEALRRSFTSADRGGRAGVAWVVGQPGSGRGTVIESACRQAGVSLRSGAPVPHQAVEPGTHIHDPRSPGTVVLGPELALVDREQVSRMQAWALASGVVVLVPARRLTADAATMIDTHGATLPHVAIPVDRLSRVELTRLLSRLLRGAPTPALVDAVWRRTSGLSGQACRTITSWLDDGRILWTPGGMGLSAGPGAEPAFVTTSGRVLSALGTLDHQAIEALAVVAVVGDSVTAEVVDRVLSRMRDGAAVPARDVLNGLTDRGLVRMGSRGYRMRNAQDQSDVCAWLRPGMLRRLHAVVAEEVGISEHERVRHLIASGQHQAALEEGDAMLVRARARGDMETVDALMALLRTSLPAARVPITVAAS